MMLFELIKNCIKTSLQKRQEYYYRRIEADLIKEEFDN